MADLAELGFAVRDEPLERAEEKLDRLVPAADKAAKATDRFNKTARESESATGKMASGMSTLTKVAVGFATGVAAAFSVTMLRDYADAWSDMQSRVGAAIKDMEAAPALMQRLVDVANSSYSPLAQTVEIYGRNVAVLRDLGRTAAETADFTESLNHMLVITATRGERAASVQDALSKAMAVGRLQADGLETVLANGGRVAEALAAELGTTVSGLRQFASEGKITGDVIARSIINPLEDVREEAGAMTATIGDAFVIMNNNITATIGQLDKATGASAAVAEGIIFLAENLHLVAAGASAVGVAVTVAMLPAIISATGAVVAFTAALLANPLTWFAAAAGTATAAIILLNKANWDAEAAARTANTAYETNAVAMDAAKASSNGYTNALRNQVAMQLEVAKAAQVAADAEYYNAVARRDAVRSMLGGLRFAPTEMDVELKNSNLNTLDNSVRRLQEQLTEIDSNLIDTESPITRIGAQAGAANDNVKKLGDGMGYLTERQKELTEQYEFGKSTFNSFFSDFRNELMNGTSLWGAFGKAGVNALNSIADRLMSMATNGLFDMLFGALGGSIMGGAPIPTGGFIPGITGPKLFQDGGYTGNVGRSAVAGLVHGQEFVMNADATRRIGVGNLQALNDNMPVSMDNNGGNVVYVDFAPVNQIDGIGLSMEEVQELVSASNEQMMDRLPDLIEGVQIDPQKRTVRY